jgi:uracil-DNA glycosylase family 4
MEATAQPYPADPPHDCDRCPRLVDYRAANAVAHPDSFNAPVPGCGDSGGWLAIVGLAPGLNGANRTGRPFTGDAAGDLLYATLAKFGLSNGAYTGAVDDGLELHGAFITNAVRCVPPANKPTSTEIHACRPFLAAQLAGLPNLKVVVALGEIAHQSAVKACGGKLPKAPFGHGNVHRLHGQHFGAVTLIDCFHPSRINTSTGRLTPDMFDAVFEAALAARA